MTLRLNREAQASCLLVPRVCVNVSTVDTSTTLLGYKTSFPVFISAAAMGRLAHPDGESPPPACTRL